jgi:hypothetical protein
VNVKLIIFLKVDGRNSPPNVPKNFRMSDVSSGVPSLVAKEKPPINVVGDVTVNWNKL